MSRSTVLNRKLLLSFLIGIILLPEPLFLNSVFAKEEINSNYPFSEPFNILLNSQTNTVFVLNCQSNEITIFDGKEKKAITSIPIGGRKPIEMKELAGNLYIINYGSNNITKFPSLFSKENITPNLAEEFLKKREFIWAGSRPVDFVYDERLQKSYTLNLLDETLTIFDINTSQTTTLTLGKFPIKIFLDPDSHKVYILNGKDSSIYVIDGEKNELIKIISITNGFSCFHAVMDEDKTKIFVSCGDNDTIYIVDTIKDELIGHLKSGGKQPFNLSLNNISRKLYVSNWFDASVSVIDVQSYKLIKKIALPQGAFPGKLTVDEASNLIFVPNTGLNNVSIIDGNKDEIIATLKTGVNPGRPVINYRTGEIYIPNPQSNSITIISKTAEGNFRTQTIPDQKGVVFTGKRFSFPLKLSFNKTANELYILNNLSGTLLILDGKSYNVKDIISVGQNPRELIFIPEINKVFITIGDEDKVFVYDTVNKSIKTIPAGDKPVYLLFNPQAKKLYTLNYNSYDLSVIDIEKEKHLLDIPLGARSEEIIFNPKENKIYVAGLVNNELVIIDGQTNEIVKKIKVGIRPSHLFYDKVYNRVFLINRGSKELTIIDGKTDQIIKSLTFDNEPTYLVLDEVRRKIYLALANKIEVIDADSLEVTSSYLLKSTGVNKMIIDQESQKLFVLAAGSGALEIVDLEDKKPTQSLNIYLEINNLANPSINLDWMSLEDMLISPRAGKLFIALGDANALAVVDIKKNRLETVVHNDGIERISYPSWQPIVRLILLIAVICAFFGLIVAILIKLKKKKNLVNSK